MKRLTLLLAAALLAALVWFLWPRHDEAETAPVVGHTASPPVSSQISNSKSQIPPAETSHLADRLNSPATDIRADLRLVSDLVATFRSNFPHDGNPVGNNAEITATLAGKNKLRFAFLPPDHPAINARGELCDRWGTPFFFHAESGARMAIRSAGPDKKLYTPDDEVLSP